ncbi:MAG: hypothetical protein K0S32_3693 [Bacteroidetes bacterium]|nr:hypothetical protein [Bacteroidota bacterium]
MESLLRMCVAEGIFFASLPKLFIFNLTENIKTDIRIWIFNCFWINGI